jgi:N-acetylneuraminic acid mutarotase
MRRPLALLVGIVAACGGDDAGDGADLDAGDDGAGSRWAAAPPMPGGPIQETAAVTVGDDVWVIGGLTSFVDYSDDVWIFDTGAGTWSAGPMLPVAMHHANAAVVDGSVYIAGYLGAGFAASGAVYRHTPGVDTGWVARTPMPAGTQRGASISGVIGGVIYVAGGLRGGGAVADVSAYDPGNDSWDDTTPDLGMPRDHGCGGVLDGALIVAGGRQGDIGSTTRSAVALTPGGAWAPRADMLTGRGGTACGVVGDQLIVVGGEGNPDAPSGVFSQTEAYDPGTNAWTTLEPMRTPRHGMAAAAVGGVLHVPGGAIQQAIGAVDTHETFTP